MTSQKDTTDHYRVLELSRDCTQKEISASYRRLALLHHPDKTGGRKSVANHFQQVRYSFHCSCEFILTSMIALLLIGIYRFRKRVKFSVIRNAAVSMTRHWTCSRPQPYMTTVNDMSHMIAREMPINVRLPSRKVIHLGILSPRRKSTCTHGDRQST